MMHPYAVEVGPHILELLHADAPVAIGVSGGKDSAALAFATTAYLHTLGHKGPRLLIHSDLGRVEWRESLPMCQRLADRLGLDLVVVRRHAGDLMDRWLVRWNNNVARYAQLACVKLILPWSTASMRFCTSELKTAIICRELVARFPGQTILSVSGIRREESPNRAKAPVAAPQLKLTHATSGTRGYDWHPILAWSREDVLAYHRLCNFPLHEAYRTYGSTRVSCCFCMLGSQADLLASTTCPDNQDIYREMVSLEIASTFRFQDKRWLGEIAPHLLDATMHTRLQEAKRQASRREAAEARIPAQLLYTRGWPTVMPTQAEAVLLSEVRREVARAGGLSIEYVEPGAILDRYAELMATKPPQQEDVRGRDARTAATQTELWAWGEHFPEKRATRGEGRA
jgi:3'-phosphoadenosine 5'-phosphosulfate sulfotransferase (PAPS reductase)/FAD synthetase